MEAMAGSQRRTASFLQLTPQQRYDRFVQLRPEIAARVPLYIVASFLGITPEAQTPYGQKADLALTVSRSLSMVVA
jgi:hypothetical protein